MMSVGFESFSTKQAWIPDQDTPRSPRKWAMKPFLRWPGRGSNQNRFRAVCVVFIADHDLHFVDFRDSFRYMKRWNFSLQSD